MRFALLAALCLCAGWNAYGDPRSELVWKLSIAVREHDAKIFYECVNFTGADDAMTKECVSLIDKIVQGPKAEATITLLDEKVIPTKDQMMLVNGPWNMVVKIGQATFLAGEVNGKCMILLPLKLDYARPVEGKPGVVLSPYNRNGIVVDTKGLSPGTVITDSEGNRPFLAPTSGGAAEPDGAVTFAASADGADPAYSLKPYYTKERLKPVRVDRSDAAGKLTEVQIFVSHLVVVFSPDGQLHGLRKYQREDFFSDDQWRHQIKVDTGRDD